MTTTPTAPPAPDDESPNAAEQNTVTAACATPAGADGSGGPEPAPRKPGMLGPEYHRPVVDPDYGADARFTCTRCGAYPAADVTLRGHRGVVVWMVFLKEPGPFCRSCGISEYRDMTEETLLKGWWSLFSVFVAPFVLLANLRAYAKLRALGEPVPGSPRAPLHVGKPLRRRPAVAMLLVAPLLAVALIAWAVSAWGDGGDDMSRAQAGQCVKNSGSDAKPKMHFADCESTDPGVLVVLERLEKTASDLRCPEGTASALSSKNADPDEEFVLCLAPVNPGSATRTVAFTS
ncbi:LppU/SCO3897 family protein [Yinghuangia soli]|uniref:Uncharacterized protein n=1 Tax=Yinghuangia soli TaxID=2908204 RepID=A0AA41PXW1_9ACTN|nr:hypothetical protein [Yinghuangia soli]MCF2527860.1 hypothetical protein [Yinghuangia soli]